MDGNHYRDRIGAVNASGQKAARVNSPLPDRSLRPDSPLEAKQKESEESAPEGGGGSRSAIDPITLMVQVSVLHR